MASREEQEYSSQAPAPYIGQFLQQDIFPFAQQFLQQQFQNLGQADSSPFTYTGQRVADFDPRELYGMELADSAIGSYRPYLGAQADLLDEAAGISREGLARGQDEISRGLSAGRGLAGLGADLTRGAQFDTAGRDLLAGAQQRQSGRGLIEGARFGQSGRSYLQGGVPNFSEAQQLTRAGAPNLDLARLETASARPQFGGARAGFAGARAETLGARPNFRGARGTLGRAEQTGYGSANRFDPSGIASFYNPFEEDVVQQTLKDVREGLAKSDMGLRDEAVSGGAFGGSRSRMRRDELAENVARGAAEQVGAIRSGGFSDAANRAQQAFEAQQQRQAGLAGLQSSIAGQEGSFAGQEAQTALGRASQLGSLAGQEAGLAGQESQAALARGRQFGDLSTTEAQNALSRAAQLGSLEAQQAQAKLATGQALNASEQAAVDNAMARGQQLNTLDQQRFANQLQQGQQLSNIDQQRFASQLQQGSQLGALGQQQFGMGLQGGQGLAGLGQQTAGALSGFGSQYGGMASLLPQLQQQDISSMMGMGGLGRGRQQSLMDLNYQNFTGQYNLPMQTLQNVGALTASLGPMAGGYGYAGGAPTTNANYNPSGTMGTGLMGLPGAGNFGFGQTPPIGMPPMGIAPPQNMGPGSFGGPSSSFQNYRSMV
ncbi:MAG: hypothetical protein CBC57_01870 [Euryarchaeota archaeon TMED97]|nr:MAG: hypothetical protein CBC57_01870 [Euryarchaeota archaeon TMED97]|tara:strand:+ start:3691 stop:5667 length:1977 start_codon:yes stop_codon:yes gene_type:complete